MLRVGPGRASGLSTSGRAGPRAWVEDFGPGSGLEFRPVATSNAHEAGLTYKRMSQLFGVKVDTAYRICSLRKYQVKNKVVREEIN